MNTDGKCFAYIDGANLHTSVSALGWKVDYHRFRIWLSDKYKVDRAYIFLGYISKNESIYADLRFAGYHTVFKETLHDSNGKIKGNCDAELVLKVTQGFYKKKINKVVLVSSDGDYACLVQFLKSTHTPVSIVSPSNKCSLLLKKLGVPILYIDSQRKILEKFIRAVPINDKAPDGDETP